MADLKDLVGKRVLVKQTGPEGHIEEGIFETEIKEVSPSGNYVRVGGGNWAEAQDYEVVEELAPVEPEEKPEEGGKEE